MLSIRGSRSEVVDCLNKMYGVDIIESSATLGASILGRCGRVKVLRLAGLDQMGWDQAVCLHLGTGGRGRVGGGPGHGG